MRTDVWDSDTGDICLVETENKNDLISAMRFKAEHIKAKVKPELFTAVADCMESAVEVVRCKDCQHYFSEKSCFCWRQMREMSGNDFCSKAKRKENKE